MKVASTAVEHNLRHDTSRSQDGRLLRASFMSSTRSGPPPLQSSTKMVVTVRSQECRVLRSLVSNKIWPSVTSGQQVKSAVSHPRADRFLRTSCQGKVRFFNTYVRGQCGRRMASSSALVPQYNDWHGNARE